MRMNMIAFKHFWMTSKWIEVEKRGRVVHPRPSMKLSLQTSSIDMKVSSSSIEVSK